MFMGTPEFAVASLDALAAAGLTPNVVVTAPDKPRGRGQAVRPTAVKEAAQRLGISRILQPESVKDPAFAAEVATEKPDIIVVVAFRILPPAVFNAARLGSFNLHGSLLPRYRGAAPINRAVMAGDAETGVTTFFLQEKVDTGNVIMKRSMPIGPEETAGDVHDRMMVLGAQAVVDTTRMILDGTAKALPQDDSLATPAPKIFKDDCRIDWTKPMSVVHNHVRGLSPYPAAWTQHGNTSWKVYLSKPSGQHALKPGVIHVEDGRLFVGCADASLELLEIQQAGKRKLPTADFLNGYPITSGDMLE